MASQQARRENVTDEKDTVSKMASHFESLADKVHEEEASSPGEVHVKKTTVTSFEEPHQGRKQQVFQEKPEGVKFDVHGQEQKDSDINRGKQSKGSDEETKGPSLEEISQYRATAQQNSMEAIRAAEERYEKAKEMGASTLHNVKESAAHRIGATGAYATEKGAQAKDTITHGLEKGTQYVAEKAGAAKDAALEKGQQAYAATKDTLSGAGQTAAQSAQKAKDYTMQKTGEAKDYLAQKTGETKDYTMQKTGEAKDYVAQKTGETKDYTMQKTGDAKDYAAQKAGDTKDYTMQKTGEAKNYAAQKTGEVKEYVAQKTGEVQEQSEGDKD